MMRICFYEVSKHGDGSCVRWVYWAVLSYVFRSVCYVVVVDNSKEWLWCVRK